MTTWQTYNPRGVLFAFVVHSGLKPRLNKNPKSNIPYGLKTTIDIPEQALKDAMRYAKVKTKRAAILAALEDFNRRQQMAELVAFSGTCKDLISFDELMELRERDLPKLSRLHSR